MEVPVSVGKQHGGKRPAGAQFAPDVEQMVQDRFSALFELIDQLIVNGTIQSAVPYTLVRPEPAESPFYCAFPQRGADGEYYPWATIHDPAPRP